MTVEIKTNLNLQQSLNFILQQKEREVGRVVADVRAGIVAKTSQGVDFAGRPFDGYSEGYARKRAETGRQVNPPNLNLTGQMMRDVQADVRREGDQIIGRVFVQDGLSVSPPEFGGRAASSVDKARWVTSGGRQFIAITNQEKENAIKRIKDA